MEDAVHAALTTKEKQQQTRAANCKSFDHEIREDPAKVRSVLQRSMDLANSRASEIRLLKETIAQQQATINTLRGVSGENARLMLELENDSRRPFPHECVKRANRAKKRKRGDKDKAPAADGNEAENDAEKECNVVRNNIVQVKLTLRRLTETGREIVSAEGISPTGLNFSFAIKRVDGQPFDASSALEWKDGLKENISGFTGATLQWRFHIRLLSSEMSNSPLYIDVNCTTPGFEHITWTSCRFMSKARRDPSRCRHGETELYNTASPGEARIE